MEANLLDLGAEGATREAELEGSMPALPSDAV